jgi:predicted acetyltransferase
MISIVIVPADALRRREFEKDILRMPLKTAYEVEINKILFS